MGRLNDLFSNSSYSSNSSDSRGRIKTSYFIQPTPVASCSGASSWDLNGRGRSFVRRLLGIFRPISVARRSTRNSESSLNSCFECCLDPRAKPRPYSAEHISLQEIARFPNYASIWPPIGCFTQPFRYNMFMRDLTAYLVRRRLLGGPFKFLETVKRRCGGRWERKEGRKEGREGREGREGGREGGRQAGKWCKTA